MAGSFKPLAASSRFLISGSPHNSLATTNLVYIYADVAASKGISDGSFVQIDNFVWKVGLIHPDKFMATAARENWTMKAEKHINESKTTVVLNGMHRDCLGLKQAADWAGLEIEVTPVQVMPAAAAGSFEMEISQFPYRPQAAKKKFENAELDALIKQHYESHVFRSGQRFFLESNPGEYLAVAVNHTQLVADMAGDDAVRNEDAIGQLTKDTILYLGNGDGIAISGSMNAPKLLAHNFNYDELGIGGLNNEFREIFRRAFATRLFPPAIIKNLGIKHVRGMLLFGPPGCGKTLIARQIGKMLNGKDPKVVNGPEILNKFVGQSEENIRNLFADAEADLAANGEAAELHVIIFDEIDAICKQRSGSTAAGSHDTIVNQLLTKIDGVDAIDNILVIGMTNRKELLDEALLRPGRLEVHVEISLPDKEGRLQIFAIHTSGMRTNKYLADDVDFDVLADETKNYTGAEIEGVCKNAAAFALFDNNIDIDNPTRPTNLTSINVTQGDFQRAICQIKPALGANSDELTPYMGHEMVDFGKRYHNLLREGKAFINQVMTNERTSLLSICFMGPVGTGKTALAAMLASGSDFPFIKMVSPHHMVGKHEATKCQTIAKVFDDAYRSPLSLIILDDLERLLEYVPIGPRFSNTLLQTLQVLVQKPPPDGHRLLVLATGSNEDFLRDAGLLPAFHVTVEVGLLNKSEILATLAARGVFDDHTLAVLEKSIAFDIGMKQLQLILEMAITNSGGGRVDADTFKAAASDCGYAMM